MNEKTDPRAIRGGLILSFIGVFWLGWPGYFDLTLSLFMTS